MIERDATLRDGTRTVTLRTEGLLPQGGNLSFHWGCVYEGSDQWALPPDGAQLPDNTHDSGDQMASRSSFGGDGSMVISFPPGVGEDVERLIGIIIRNDGADWLHADVGDLTVPIKPPSADGVLKALANGGGALYTLT